MTDPQTPVACSLDAGDFHDRLAWIAALNRDHLSDALGNGGRLVLTYRPDALSRVRDLVAKESACCAFLAFDLAEEADAVRLTVSVPEEARGSAELLLAPFLGGTEQLQGSGEIPPKTCGDCR